MAITEFQGDHRWLSNFWPCVVSFDGVNYPSVEHAYQASKTFDLEERAEVLRCATPGQAKRYGRRVTIRGDFGNWKLSIMELLLAQKFEDAHLRQKLIDTGSVEIIECNNWGDTYWGVCNSVGENHLGKLLMGLRARL